MGNDASPNPVEPGRRFRYRGSFAAAPIRGVVRNSLLVEGQQEALVRRDLIARHRPTKGDYYVVFDGGHEAIVQKGIFETNCEEVHG